MPSVLAHVSDLHLSAYGDTFHDARKLVARSKRVVEVDDLRQLVVWREAGWQLAADRLDPAAFVLLDPDGYAHTKPRLRAKSSFANAADLAAGAVAYARHMEARRAAALAVTRPSAHELDARLAESPKNSNLRFLKVMAAIEQAQVDTIVLTGDLTDHGDGYELLASELRRSGKRILAIPGNHDAYLFPIAGSTRPIATVARKRENWLQFAASFGLDVDACGAWSQTWDDVAVIGLNSCARSQRLFYRHNGAIGRAQTAYVRAVAASSAWRNASHRLVLLHHHIVRLANHARKRPSSEFGMRLDDADTAVKLFDEVGVTLVMHGHRHVSEERQPPGCKFRLLAAPSATLGCRSGDGPSMWRVELGERVHAERVPVPLAPLAHDSLPAISEQ